MISVNITCRNQSCADKYVYECGVPTVKIGYNSFLLEDTLPVDHSPSNYVIKKVKVGTDVEDVLERRRLVESAIKLMYPEEFAIDFTFKHL